MKILAIRCKNLASLHGEHSVDFTCSPLAEAGLFAITGPTGSGKSTLLDALCLALYNKTPRANSNKLKQTYILRRGTGEGYAEVEFVALDGHRYRSRWSLKRAHNAPNGKLQNVAVELHNLTENQIVADTPGRTFDRIEQLIGLTFEQFTRAVLLAQGEFASFLKASENEKAAILEKLTGTDLFSLISIKIHERQQAEKKKLDELKTALGTIVLLTEEQKQEMEQTKRDRQAEADRIAGQIDLVGRSIQWWQDRAKIGAEKEAAENALRDASLGKAAAAPKIQWLEEWEKAQEVQLPMRVLATAMEQLAAGERELAALKKDEAERLADKQALEDQRERAQRNLSEKQAELERAKPLLNQARTLDERIDGFLRQEQQARHDWESAQAALAAAATQLGDNEKQRAFCLSESADLQKWLEEHAGLKPLARDFALVEERLEQADRSKNESARLEKEREEKSRALADAEGRLADGENRQIELSARQRALSDRAESLRGEWHALEKERLLAQKQALDDRARQLETAKYLWAELQAAHRNLLELRQKRSEAEAEHQQASTCLAEDRLRLSALDAALEVAREMWERSRFLLAENVESLRAALQEGDPCAVCGSTEHPYARHLPVHDALLKEQEDVLKAKQREREACYASVAQSEARCRFLTEELERTALQLPDLERIFTEKKQAWDAGPLAPESASVQDTDRPKWLEAQGEKARFDLGTVEKSLAECARLENLLAENSAQAPKIENALTAVQGEIKLANTQIETARLALGELSAAAELSRHQYAELVRSLSLYFAQPGWEAEWAGQPVAFREKNRRAANDWNDRQDRLVKVNESLIGLEAATGPLQVQVKEKQDEEARKKEQLAGLRHELAVLRAQRADLFGGRSAVEVENGLEMAVRHAQAQWEDAVRKLSELQNALTELSTKQQFHQDQMDRLRQQIAEQDRAIKTWTQRQTADTGSEWTFERLRAVLGSPLEEVHRLRAEVKEIDNRLAVSQQALDTVSAKWDRHLAEQKTDTPLEVLLEEKGDLGMLRDKCIGDITNIETAFKQDAENRARHNNQWGEMAAQEAVALNWAKLDDDLGSAAGDKFRKIAQGFTLDTLLAYANVHLGQLAKRYRLQRQPDKLELEVVDIDMGDEVRPVFSLSGGETFLVSLALALGLSSLSSSQMHVESLFIDEGFGSLDPETLATAMDALESLQNQGRKIGVISHVQDMTEKIQTQIQVRVLSKGRSTVQVVSID
jgi:exonuclease SbcC